MPSTILDSAVFRDIFTTPAMRQRVVGRKPGAEISRLRGSAGPAQGRLGIIPKNAAAEIVAPLRRRQIIDMAKLKEATERIGYPVLPVVQQLVKLCKDGLGEWCHWGATTQDITDTATVLQIREALDLVEKDIDAIANALAEAGEEIPRHADGRAQQPAAGGADHLRLQDGDAARPPSSATSSASPSCGRACWSANSAAPPARCPRSARTG